MHMLQSPYLFFILTTYVTSILLKIVNTDFDLNDYIGKRAQSLCSLTHYKILKINGIRYISPLYDLTAAKIVKTKAAIATTGINRNPIPININIVTRSEEHTSELQSRGHLVCRLLLEKKKTFFVRDSFPY